MLQNSGNLTGEIESEILKKNINKFLVLPYKKINISSDVKLKNARKNDVQKIFFKYLNNRSITIQTNNYLIWHSGKSKKS